MKMLAVLVHREEPG